MSSLERVSRTEYGVPQEGVLASAARRIRQYFAVEEPNFWAAMVPAVIVAAILFTRNVTTNFIFDEQEALLANPYVNGQNLRFVDAFRRDFWGLPPDRSVGSYRPIPNVLWRAIASSMHALHDAVARVTHVQGTFALYPWVFHWCNVMLHAVNSALLVCIVFRVTKRRSLAWLSGATFLGCAVLTEAVSGVVGTADVLGGLGALLALAALGLPLWGMPFAMFAAMLLGLFSKESALVCVPLVPLAALWLSPYTHPRRPLSIVRMLFALAATVGAFILYVELRKRWFPSPLASDLDLPLPHGAGRGPRALRSFLRWFHQPALPRDPLNNPLINADFPHRTAGALRVYWRGLVQLAFPNTLSGDYSFPQEPVPDRIVFPESVLGGLGMIVPPIAAVGLWFRAIALRRRAKRHAAATEQAGPTSFDPRLAGVWHALLAVALVWVVVSYFPHSNIPVVLPTVRAERFLYFPAIGSSVAIACYFAAFHRSVSTPWAGRLGSVLFAIFFGFQCVKARLHAFDYADDLTFWRATKDSVPRSAKAHLNYSVMWGARGHLDTRLDESNIAVGLAPKWPMAHIYLGDTLCRLHRANEAWPHYVDGFKLADNDPNLISLAIQCLWEEGAFKAHETELVALADEHPDSWLDFLVKDVANYGNEHGGVNPKYRPRGYNEGPKE